MRCRRGFALLAVLWLVVALVTLAGTGVVAVRRAGMVSSNRIALSRGRWAAEGCLALVQGELDSVVKVASRLVPLAPDSIAFADGAECGVTMYAPSARLNVEAVTSEMRAQFDTALATYGVRVLRDSLLTSEGDGQIDVNAAAAPVLAALPGFGSEAVRAVLERRSLGRRLTDLYDVLGRLPPPARDVLVERFGEAQRWVTFAPTGLVVRATGSVRGLRPIAAIEVLVVGAGSRAAVVRRRMW